MKALRRRHYEVWVRTTSGATIVGDADTLPAALKLYVRTRKAKRGHMIDLLVDELASPGVI